MSFSSLGLLMEASGISLFPDRLGYILVRHKICRIACSGTIPYDSDKWFEQTWSYDSIICADIPCRDYYSRIPIWQCFLFGQSAVCSHVCVCLHDIRMAA